MEYIVTFVLHGIHSILGLISFFFWLNLEHLWVHHQTVSEVPAIFSAGNIMGDAFDALGESWMVGTYMCQSSC